MYLPLFIKNIHSIRVETAVKLISYAIALTGYAGVFAHVGYAYRALFVLSVSIAGYLDYRKGGEEVNTSEGYVPRWIINVLSVLVIILSVFRMSKEDLVEPAVEALLVLLSIKFLERRRFRDYMQIYLISLFLLAGAALLSVDLSFFLYFIIFFFLVSSAIVLLTYYSQAPELVLQRAAFVKIVLKTMVIPLFSIPMASIIFLVLPRTDYPFFSFLNRSGKGRAGFADNVMLGGVSSIQQDSSVIFRAAMEKIDDELLYWRGILFDVFDGTSWKSSLAEGPPGATQADYSKAKGRRITQTIYLEPYENKYIFALDKPIYVFLRNVRSPGGFIYLTKGNIKNKLRYDAISAIGEGQPGNAPDGKYLTLPEGIPPKITALAKKLTKGKGKRAAAESILSYLRDGTYSYSLENLPTSRWPLDEFLFKTKSGNCEYFASSMAVMLRASGIAANVIGGYKGGQYNNIGGYYMVMQKNAHVWVEAYIDGEGWTRLDPTPTAAFSFDMETRGVLRLLQIALDALDYYWSSFVINYNFDKQLSMFKKLRMNIGMPALKSSLLRVRSRSKTIAATGAALVALILSVAALKRLGLLNKTPEEKRLLDKFLRKLRKRGLEKKPSEGLEEFTSSIDEEGLRQKAGAFAAEFGRIYYKDEEFTKERLKRLRAMLKVIHKYRPS
jgi:transglutaminase-like putative cysteine protease